MVSHLSEISQRLRLKFKHEIRRGTVLLRNENTFGKINTESFAKLIVTDSGDMFSTRYCVLGHLQRGDSPSPIDRINATILVIKSIDILTNNDLENISEQKKFIGVIGIEGQKIIFSDINEIMKNFDVTNKRHKSPNWITYAGICRSIE